MMCVLCGNVICHCDRDDTNPVDCSAERWAEIVADPEYDLSTRIIRWALEKGIK